MSDGSPDAFMMAKDKVDSPIVTINFAFSIDLFTSATINFAFPVRCHTHCHRYAQQLLAITRERERNVR
jgi:hypothetical protein